MYPYNIVSSTPSSSTYGSTNIINNGNGGHNSRQKDDSDLADHIKKAVNGVELASKTKHIGRILGYAMTYQTCAPIWQVLHMQPGIWSDQVQGYKTLTLIHRLLLLGPYPIALTDALKEQRFLIDLIDKLGSENRLGAGYGPLIKRLGSYILQKITFHSTTSGPGQSIPPNYDYSDYDAVKCISGGDHGRNEEKQQQSTTTVRALLNQLAIIVDLMQYILKTGNGSECKLAPLVCMVPESFGLYKYVTSVLTLLHMCSDQPYTSLIQEYNKQFQELKSIYLMVKSIPMLKMIIDIPIMPERPVKFDCFAPEERVIPVPTSIIPISNSNPVMTETREEFHSMEILHQENQHLRQQITLLHQRALAWKQSMEQEGQRDVQHWKTLYEQSQQECQQLRDLLNQVRLKYSQAIKDNDTLLMRIQQIQNEQSSEKNEDDPFHAGSGGNPDISNSGINEDGDLEATLRIIEQIAIRMMQYKPEATESQLAEAIRLLVERAIQVQQVIIQHSGEPDERTFYLKNSVWSKGLQSAAHRLSHYTSLLEGTNNKNSTPLLKNNNNNDNGEHKNETTDRIRAAAKQLNIGTIQLVAAARVKCPTCPQLESLLQAAATVSYLAKLIDQNTFNAKVDENGNDNDDGEKTGNDFTTSTNGTNQKIIEMNLTVEVMNKERQLQEARQKLAKLRQSVYHPNDGDDESGKERDNKSAHEHIYKVGEVNTPNIPNATKEEIHKLENHNAMQPNLQQ